MRATINSDLILNCLLFATTVSQFEHTCISESRYSGLVKENVIQNIFILEGLMSKYWNPYNNYKKFYYNYK